MICVVVIPTRSTVRKHVHLRVHAHTRDLQAMGCDRVCDICNCKRIWRRLALPTAHPHVPQPPRHAIVGGGAHEARRL
jgi:hypothetical protein